MNATAITEPNTPFAVSQRRERDRIAEVVGHLADGWTDHELGIYRASRAEARRLGDLELERWADMSRYRLAFDDTDPDTLAMLRVREVPEAAAIAVERRFRQRMLDEGRVVPFVPSKQYAALGDLLKRIDQGIALADLIERETRYTVIRGKRESHCACPQCGTGTDRLVLWPGFPSWGYCRQCEWKPSVVGMAAFLWGLDVRDADQLREVAVRLGREYLSPSPEAA